MKDVERPPCVFGRPKHRQAVWSDEASELIMESIESHTDDGDLVSRFLDYVRAAILSWSTTRRDA